MLVKNTIEKHPARDLKVRANVRKVFDSDEESKTLGGSYIRHPIHPLIILPDLSLLDGERRLRGVMLIDPGHPLGCLTVDRELSPAERTELQLVSGLTSAALRPYDQAVAMKAWMEQNPGATAKDLAEKIDLHPSNVSRLLSLWKAIPAVAEAAATGVLTPKAWHPLSMLPESEQYGLLQMHLAGLPGTQIAELGRKKRAAAAAPPAEKSGRAKFVVPGKGVTLQVVCESAMTLDQMIDAAQDWVKRARRASDNGWDSRTLEQACRDEAKKLLS